ncbi:hypothetical protein A2U01_0093049, partial [Trifolium medium]|nr:hypothetical protein [Trifolium medium]
KSNFKTLRQIGNAILQAFNTTKPKLVGMIPSNNNTTTTLFHHLINPSAPTSSTRYYYYSTMIQS